LCAELDGNGFFLDITSIGNFLVKKSEKYVQKGAHFSVFFGQKFWGYKNGRKTTNFTRQIFLKFGLVI
jgi:hypothetical protein